MVCQSFLLLLAPGNRSEGPPGGFSLLNLEIQVGMVCVLHLLPLPVHQHSATPLLIPLSFPTSSPFPPPHQFPASPPCHHQQSRAHFQQLQISPSPAAHISFLRTASPPQPFSLNTDIWGLGWSFFWMLPSDYLNSQ